MLEHVIGYPRADLQVRQAKIGVERIALRFFQRDLQLRAPARRLMAQQFFRRHRQRPGQRFDQRELRLTAPVLQQRQRRRRAPDPGAKLREGKATRAPQVP
jgi:predicted nucleic acid-binding Zn ribbon protein